MQPVQPVRLVLLPAAVASLPAVPGLLRLVGRLLARRVALALLLLAARLPLPLLVGRWAPPQLLPLRLVAPHLLRLHLMLVGLPRRLPAAAWSVSA